MIVGWKIWYANEGKLTSYQNTDILWDDLPDDGCLGLVLFEDGKKPDGNQLKLILSSHDYYFKSGEIYGCDVEVRERNTQQEIAKRYSDAVIIRGIWTTNDLMADAEEEMREAQLCL